MINTITLTGNLGKAAETKTTQTGKTCAVFSLAFSSKNGKEDYTKWVRCTLWSQYAIERNVPRLQKGTRVIISGRPSFRQWADQNGEIHEEFEVSVTDIEYVAKNAVAAQPQQFQPQQYVQQYNAAQQQPMPQPTAQQAVAQQWPTAQVQPAYADSDLPF